MSTQNTKIAASKLYQGIKLPFETRDAGDGYAASGECVTRQMTDEEREKYGPVSELKRRGYSWGNKKQKEGDIVSSKINQAVKVDIEKPAEDIGTINWADNPQECADALIKAGGILVKPPSIIFGKETTALDAADEFYTLQEEVAEIAEQRQLDEARDKARMDTKLARMQILKDALEAVTVTI